MSRGAWLALAGVALLVLTRRGLVDRLTEAIGYVESRGRYDAIGPATRSGDRAYGKYQVMGVNVPAWTRAALGRTLTPQQFLVDPAAQDRTARTELARLLAQYGNAADVASVWFSGDPLDEAGTRSDVTGVTVPQYVQAVLARL